MIQSLPENTVFEISRELSIIAFNFEELKHIRKLEFAERMFNTIIVMNTITEEELLFMQK